MAGGAGRDALSVTTVQQKNRAAVLMATTDSPQTLKPTREPPRAFRAVPEGVTGEVGVSWSPGCLLAVTPPPFFSSHSWPPPHLLAATCLRDGEPLQPRRPLPEAGGSPRQLKEERRKQRPSLSEQQELAGERRFRPQPFAPPPPCGSFPVCVGVCV